MILLRALNKLEQAVSKNCQFLGEVFIVFKVCSGDYSIIIVDIDWLFNDLFYI